MKYFCSGTHTCHRSKWWARLVQVSWSSIRWHLIRFTSVTLCNWTLWYLWQITFSYFGAEVLLPPRDFHQNSWYPAINLHFLLKLLKLFSGVHRAIVMVLKIHFNFHPTKRCWNNFKLTKIIVVGKKKSPKMEVYHFQMKFIPSRLLIDSSFIGFKGQRSQYICCWSILINKGIANCLGSDLSGWWSDQNEKCQKIELAETLTDPQGSDIDGARPSRFWTSLRTRSYKDSCALYLLITDRFCSMVTSN